jgi:hypothetical protein
MSFLVWHDILQEATVSFNILVSIYQATYEECLKSNETRAIKFFINSWTINQHYPLQISSLGKPHTARGVAPTPGNSAESLRGVVPSAGLSPVVHSSKMMTFEEEFAFREKEGVTRAQTGREWRLWNHWNTVFGQKFIHRDGSVTEFCCDAASKCPQSLAGHNEPFFRVIQGPHSSTVY